MTHTDAWDGLLLPYQTTIDLTRDNNGNPFGTQSDSGKPRPLVYQYLRERWEVQNAQSASVIVP